MVKESITINPNRKLPKDNRRSGLWISPLSSEEIKYFNKVYNKTEKDFIGRVRTIPPPARIAREYLLEIFFSDELNFLAQFIGSLETFNLNLSDELEKSVEIKLDLPTIDISLTDILTLFQTEIVDLESILVNFTTEFDFTGQRDASATLGELNIELETLISVGYSNEISLSSDLEYEVQIIRDLGINNLTVGDEFDNKIEILLDLSDIEYLNLQIPDEDF